MRLMNFYALAFAILLSIAPEIVIAGGSTQVIKSDLSSAIGDSQAQSFHVDVQSRWVDGYVTYTITNRAEDWPKYTLVGIYWAGTNAVYANRRVKLKKGQSITLRADFKGHAAQPIDLWIKPVWAKQEFVVRSRHTPPPGWREAGKKRVKRVF